MAEEPVWEKRQRAELVADIVRGFVTFDDGSQSPPERWVRASDERWVSLDSERQTRRDLTWMLDDCICGWNRPLGPACPDCGGVTTHSAVEADS